MMKGSEDCIDILRRYTHDNLALICDFERINTEHRCGTPYVLPNRDTLFLNAYAYPALAGHVINSACKSTPGRVLHRMNGTNIEHMFHHPPEWCNIRSDLLPEVESLTVCDDCNPVITKSTGYDDNIARKEPVIPYDILSDT